ncbi:hypothetical protein [Actinomadura viridis]|uniref:Uncharacterized protein n=1 Tax=Actinomadura viridis TaxID=58110 RepID=A0A931DH55_9ACTN|nr:hypothetical protein [Actinomadura viridis]MBG6086820.1 hypothetical protein [Actinomadura viridis]
MLEKKKVGLWAAGFVLLVVTLEVLALQVGSLELDLPRTPAMAENSAP